MTEASPDQPRPRGNPNFRKATAPLQEPTQEPVLEAMQVSVAQNGRHVVRVNGENFTRKRTQETDQFHVPAHLIPEGWDYQWNVVTVHGQEFVDIQIAMAENGWRAVPAGRHPGMFMPRGTPQNSEILRGGLRLEERPKILSDEARAEDKRNAERQLSGAKEALNLTMPSGFTRNNSDLQRVERARTSRTIGPAPDISRPALPIDESS